MSDSQKEPENVTMESGPLMCGHCQTPFTNVVIEELDGRSQLRAGNLLFRKTEASCLNCGWEFRWSIREQDVQEMAVRYGDILKYGSISTKHWINFNEPSNVTDVRVDADGKIYIKKPGSDEWIGPLVAP